MVSALRGAARAPSIDPVGQECVCQKPTCFNAATGASVSRTTLEFGGEQCQEALAVDASPATVCFSAESPQDTCLMSQGVVPACDSMSVPG